MGVAKTLVFLFLVASQDVKTAMVCGFLLPKSALLISRDLGTDTTLTNCAPESVSCWIR